MTQSDQNPTMAQRLRSALLARDFSGLEPVLANDVRFGSCVGPAQVIDYLSRALGQGVAVEVAESETYEDRLIISLVFSASESEQLPFGQQRPFAVVFVHDDQIIELTLTADRDQATAAALSPPPPPRPRTPTTLNRSAAVLPVRDLSLALDHYRRLGFSVRSYHGGGYGYAERDGLNLHLSVVANLDPTTTTSAIYIYVDDADLLYAEWRSSGVSGQFFEPHDTDYGLREGAHIDRDGNLIRFGSPLNTPAERKR